MTPQDWQALLDKYGAAFWTNIATPAWELAVRQVYVTVAQDLIWAAAFGTLAIVLITVVQPRLWAKRTEFLARDRAGKGEYQSRSITSEDTDIVTFGVGAAVVIGCVAAVLALVLVSEVAAYLINPQWYALQNLLGTVKK